MNLLVACQAGIAESLDGIGQGESRLDHGHYKRPSFELTLTHILI